MAVKNTEEQVGKTQSIKKQNIEVSVGFARDPWMFCKPKEVN